jgi:hypothetical protein
MPKIGDDLTADEEPLDGSEQATLEQIPLDMHLPEEAESEAEPEAPEASD